MLRKDDLLTAATLGSLTNFPWEMAHSLLYRGVADFTWKQHLLCCGLAALADGAGVAAIFAVGALAFREPRWTRKPSAAKVLLTLVLGVVSAVLVEILALRLGWWAYEPSMPRLSGTNIGLSPLMQFIVLPLLVLFGLLPRLQRRIHRTVKNSHDK